MFSITGRGTVVTGVVAGGPLRTGQQVTVYRDGRPVLGAQISGIEAFRKLLDGADPGQNVGLLLRGVQRDQLHHGDQIVVTG